MVAAVGESLFSDISSSVPGFLVQLLCFTSSSPLRSGFNRAGAEVRDGHVSRPERILSHKLALWLRE